MNLTLKDQIAAYWSARAASFDASPGHGIGPGAETSAWLRLIDDRLGGLENRRVLELASGTGEFTRLLLETGAEVTGLDLSEEMIRRARIKTQAASGRVSLYLGDAENTLEPDQSYDAVVCRHLVWTLPEPARAVSEWFRVLRPGGRMLIIDGDWERLPWHGRMRRALGQVLQPLFGPPPEPIDWAAHRQIMAQVHFAEGLRPGPFIAMLQAAGFERIETGPITAIRHAQRKAARFPRSLAVGIYDDFWLTAHRPTA